MNISFPVLRVLNSAGAILALVGCSDDTRINQLEATLAALEKAHRAAEGTRAVLERRIEDQETQLRKLETVSDLSRRLNETTQNLREIRSEELNRSRLSGLSRDVRSAHDRIDILDEGSGTGDAVTEEI